MMIKPKLMQVERNRFFELFLNNVVPISSQQFIDKWNGEITYLDTSSGLGDTPYFKDKNGNFFEPSPSLIGIKAEDKYVTLLNKLRERRMFDTEEAKIIASILLFREGFWICNKDLESEIILRITKEKVTLIINKIEITFENKADFWGYVSIYRTDGYFIEYADENNLIFGQQNGIMAGDNKWKKLFTRIKD